MQLSYRQNMGFFPPSSVGSSWIPQGKEDNPQVCDQPMNLHTDEI